MVGWVDVDIQKGFEDLEYPIAGKETDKFEDCLFGDSVTFPKHWQHPKPQLVFKNKVINCSWFYHVFVKYI